MINNEGVKMANEAKLLFQEAEINRFLQLTLKTYLQLKKQGRDKLARMVLRVGSETAEIRMKQLGIKPYKVYCPKCRKQIKNGLGVEFVNDIGMCYMCDHLESDHDY